MFASWVRHLEFPWKQNTWLPYLKRRHSTSHVSEDSNSMALRLRFSWCFVTLNSRHKRRYSGCENGICRKYLKIIGSLENVGNAHTKAYWFDKVLIFVFITDLCADQYLSVKRCINVDIQIQSVFSADLQDNICLF